MGQSSTNHFMPSQPQHHHSQVIMTKVWTFNSHPKADHQLSILKDIQAEQCQHSCKIACSHIQSIDEGTCFKVITAFEYPSRSLRQQIIMRKKKMQFPQYFTQKQLQNILNLAGYFITKYFYYLCDHSDLWSNILIFQGQFKQCHPELLPCRCSNSMCKSNSFNQRAIDLLLQLLLLQKVVRGGNRQKQKAQYLYSHSKWLNQLLQKMFQQNMDILQVSQSSKYYKSTKYTLQHVKSQKKPFSQLARFTKSIQSSPFSPNRAPIEQLPQTKQFKLGEETKASNTNRIRYYSDLSQFQNERGKQQKKQMLLDCYQKELAQSIGQNQDSSSFVVSPTLYDHVHQNDFVVHRNVEYLHTDSYLMIEPVPTQQQQQKIKKSRNVLNSIIPNTILQEQNQAHSQQSRHSRQTQKEFKIIQQEGYRYQGQMVDGKKHGKGVFIYPNGVCYEGDWNMNQMDGIGSLFYPSGRPYYRGEWKKGMFNGRGIFYNQEPQAIVGSYNFRDFTNLGRRWRVFQGNFRQDKKEGQGILTLSNGQILQAQWRNNIVQGRGQFHSLNNKIIKGIWIQNILYLQDNLNEMY